MNKKKDGDDLDFLAPKKRFIFDPRTLHEISKKAAGKSLEDAFEIINDELVKAYPRRPGTAFFVPQHGIGIVDHLIAGLTGAQA